jgi:hypothetical protein
MNERTPIDLEIGKSIYFLQPKHNKQKKGGVHKSRYFKVMRVGNIRRMQLKIKKVQLQNLYWANTVFNDRITYHCYMVFIGFKIYKLKLQMSSFTSLM